MVYSKNLSACLHSVFYSSGLIAALLPQFDLAVYVYI